ncbi:hypothetical protein K502DRAFT_352254 [Neoconidiobolus thromboides FSU 785]|nr:hypothetical protein K502DRAFT_352254 [Neoconidiobolus thromboides FSU 785]
MKFFIVALALVSLISFSFVTIHKSGFLDFIVKEVKSVDNLLYGKVVSNKSFCLEKDNVISKDVIKKYCDNIYKAENLIHFNGLKFFYPQSDDRLKGCCEKKHLSFYKGECPERR